MPKLNPKNIKNKVKNTQKYLQNPPKMGPKSLPGTLQGALLQKNALFPPKVRTNGPQMEPRGSPKVTKNHKNSKKEGPKKTPKISTSKSIEN